MPPTAGVGQTPAILNPALVDPGAMPVGAAFAEAQAALIARRKPSQPAYGRNRATPGLAGPLLGQDVSFDAIRAEVAQGIDRSIHAAIASGAEAQVMEEFQDALSHLLDDIGGEGGLEEWLDGLASQEGAKETRRLLESAERLTKGLSRIAERVAGLKHRADEEIEAAVKEANTVLERLADACRRISVNAACGYDPVPIYEERDEQLALLFALLDVVSFIRGDGTAGIYLRGGGALLDGPMPRRLGFVFGGGVTLDGRDIGTEIGSGRLFGLLSLRDRHLQGLVDQLDALSQMLRDQVNRLFNRAIAQPVHASGSYAGSREFLNPGQERLSIGGGDCLLTLYDEGGTMLADACVSQLAARALAGEGRPAASPWTVAGFVQALDDWLRRHLRTEALLAFLDDAGRLCLALPGGKLTWRDQRCTALDSVSFADPDRPLGTSGPLAFRDIFCNLFVLQVAATDSLRDLVDKVKATGLAAAIVAQRDGQVLRVNNPAGCDLYLESEAAPGPAALLRLLPARPLPGVDLTVDWDIDQMGVHLETAPFASHNRPLDMDGPLAVLTQDGRRSEFWIDPGMTLAALVGSVNASSSRNGLSAIMKEAGNRWIMRITGESGWTLSAEGPVAGALGLRPPPDVSASGLACFFGLNDFFAPPKGRDHAESKPIAAGFATFNLTGLTVTQRHGRRQCLSFPGDLGLEAVAALIAAQSDLVAAELVEADEGFRRLLITAIDGGALQVTGSLAVLLSLGEGARPPSAPSLECRPDLVPESLSPSAAMLMAEALKAPLTVPPGQFLSAGSVSLRQVAEGIVSHHRRLLSEGRSLAVYQRILTDSLRRHRRQMNRLDMDADALEINTFRDAYLGNASVMSGLSRLAAQLETALH